MKDAEMAAVPRMLPAIAAATAAAGFSMASDIKVGALLRTLATGKPGGVLLELGTGTGLSTVWLLDGMDRATTLVTVDNDGSVQAIAQHHLGADARVRFHCGDGGAFLENMAGQGFDLIFADTWPGKYDHLEDALGLLKPGGFYVVDDMLPQPNWPADHAPKVPPLIAALESHPDLMLAKVSWSTGIILATKKSDR